MLAGVPPIVLASLTIPTWWCIFLASVRVGISGTLRSYWKLREVATIRQNQLLDIPGNVAFGVGLALLLVAVTNGLLPYGSSILGCSNP